MTCPRTPYSKIWGSLPPNPRIDAYDSWYASLNNASCVCVNDFLAGSNLSPINGNYSVGATSAPLASRASQPSELTLTSQRKPVRLESLPNMSALKPDKKHFRKT